MVSLCTGSGRAAAAVLLLLLVLLLATSPPRVEARALLAVAGARSSMEIDGGTQEAAAAGWSALLRGPPASGATAGRWTAGRRGNAVGAAVAERVLGSVPSPGVGH
ncbi:hypothetical protein ACQJBY_062669 [Aegilops geniculata]